MHVSRQQQRERSHAIYNMQVCFLNGWYYLELNRHSNVRFLGAYRFCYCCYCRNHRCKNINGFIYEDTWCNAIPQVGVVYEVNTHVT